jgi:hypothetical protein
MIEDIGARTWQGAHFLKPVKCRDINGIAIGFLKIGGFMPGNAQDVVGMLYNFFISFKFNGFGSEKDLMDWIP